MSDPRHDHEHAQTLRKIARTVTDGLAEVRDWEKAALEAGAASLERTCGTCRWVHVWDAWETACGLTWYFDGGGPEENRVAFCHGCGHRIEAVEDDGGKETGDTP